MNGFWKAVSEDIENVRIRQADSFGPYSEFTERWLEEKTMPKQVSVNGFYRFDAIMQALFGEERVEPAIQDWLFDVYMHALVPIGLRTGMSYQELQIRQKWNALADGTYGEKNAEIFCSLDSDRKYYIAHALWSQEQTGAGIRKFADVMVRTLEKGIVYKNKCREKQILLYVSNNENTEDAEVIALVQELFLPLGYELDIFWEKHFAVIGQEQTMQLDEIKLL